jgi:holliday junction DNA helicase RuvA
MIGSIHGTVIHTEGHMMLIDVNGIGYRVATPKRNYPEAGIGSSLTLFTRLIVREHALELYGFAHEEECRIFERLISVSGVGPKTGLIILDTLHPRELMMALAHRDSSVFKSISGIGKKTAEKIILELGEHFEHMLGSDYTHANDTYQEALDALIALGFSREEMRTALQQLDPSITDTSTKITMVLKKMHHS